MMIRDTNFLSTMYNEAWKQYSHEDNLYQNRSNLFLGLNTAFIAVVGVAISNAGVSEVKFVGYDCFVYILLTAIAALVTGIAALRVNGYWKNTVAASRAHLSLRISTAWIIEQKLETQGMGLAETELRWAKWSKNQYKTGDEHVWFPSGIENPLTKEEYRIRPKPAEGGFEAQYRLINMLRRLWIVVLVMAGLAITVTIGMWLSEIIA